MRGPGTSIRTLVVAAACAALLAAPGASAGTVAAAPTRSPISTMSPVGRPLSDTLTYGGHTVTYTIGGASVPTGALANGYDGVVTAGAGVWLSGSASYTLPDNGVTRLSQSASIGSEQKSYSEDVGGPYSHTMDFSLSVTAPGGVPDSTGVITVIYVAVTSLNCGGICEGVRLELTLAVVSAGPGPTPTPTPSTSPPPGDTTPPVVRMRPTPGVFRVGDDIPMHFSVEDDSGKAGWFVVMFSNGTQTGTGHSRGIVSARGEWRTGRWSYPRTTPGPFYMCVYAVDRAGNRSVGEPYSACRWISVQVPLPRVSNGCGGSDWGDAALAVMNWFGDVRRYAGIDVPMKPACDKHDGAYAGSTVAGIRTGRPIDYRTWSRDDIDTQFGQDLQYQCRRYLKGPRHAAARTTCLGDVVIYLDLVRRWGTSVYDADVTVAGTQASAPATTVPPGGGRQNN